MSRAAGKTAVVLSGGGAYGAFAVGVLKVLFAGRSPATEYEPLDASIFSGTSVGSVNAAAMVGHRGSGLDAVLHLEGIWTNELSNRPDRCGNGAYRIRGDFTDYLDPACLRSPGNVLARLAGDGLTIGSYLFSRTANFLASSSPLEDRAIGLLNADSFVDVSPLLDLLRNTIDAGEILRSSKRLSITATDWVTGKAAHFDNNDFVGDRGFQAIMASTAVPGVFAPVRVEGQVCVDGGVVQNTPLNPAIKMGATELHVIYLDPQPQFIPLKGEANTLDTVLRVYYMMLASKLDADIETARWINQGLDVIEDLQKSRPLSPGDASKVVRVAGRIFETEGRPFNKLVVHRYYPKKALGGDFGMLNFELDGIIRMIGEGERAALNHDCKDSDCVRR
jgi:predicted acylesterase/phospholipase RssA